MKGVDVEQPSRFGIDELKQSGWRVECEWKNKYGNHWVLLTPEGRIWSGQDNLPNEEKAWLYLSATVPPKPRFKIDVDNEKLVIVDTNDLVDPIVAHFHNPQRAAFVLHVLNGEMSINLLLGLPTTWLSRRKEWPQT